MLTGEDKTLKKTLVMAPERAASANAPICQRLLAGGGTENAGVENAGVEISARNSKKKQGVVNARVKMRVET